jgi:hypothetical protein
VIAVAAVEMSLKEVAVNRSHLKTCLELHCKPQLPEEITRNYSRDSYYSAEGNRQTLIDCYSEEGFDDRHEYHDWWRNWDE